MTLVRETTESGTVNPVRAALESCRAHFRAAAIFSAVANLLALVPSLYMMQIYDRVLPGGNVSTLVTLSLVGMFGLAILSALDWLRARLFTRAAAALDAELAAPTFEATIARASADRHDRGEAMRELDTLRQAVGSPVAGLIFDLPWTPIYILVATLMHPALGALSLGAALLMLWLAWHNGQAMQSSVAIANEAGRLAHARQAIIASRASDIRSLGMSSALARAQLDRRKTLERLQMRTTFVSGNHAAFAKFLRMIFQSGALAIGALLVIDGHLSGGAVFASSLLLTRALAPIDQITLSWRAILQARTAYRRLSALLAKAPSRSSTYFPDPSGAVQVDHATLLAPQSDRIAIVDINFAIEAGEALAIVGPSGAGKSTLLRGLTGADLPARGWIRFDGAATQEWDPTQLAAAIGYLPQNPVLFPGTIKENIARFRTSPAADIDAMVIWAAEAIGAHQTILRLPDGYDTHINETGAGLSAGHTQRIAIARALFGNPKLLMLDEPSTHLDSEAQSKLFQMLAEASRDGKTVIFTTHNSEMLTMADKILALREGRQHQFGLVGDLMALRRPALKAAAT